VIAVLLATTSKSRFVATWKLTFCVPPKLCHITRKTVCFSAILKSKFCVFSIFFAVFSRVQRQRLQSKAKTTYLHPPFLILEPESWNNVAHLLPNKRWMCYYRSQRRFNKSHNWSTFVDQQMLNLVSYAYAVLCWAQVNQKASIGRKHMPRFWLPIVDRYLLSFYTRMI